VQQVRPRLVSQETRETQVLPEMQEPVLGPAAPQAREGEREEDMRLPRELELSCRYVTAMAEEAKRFMASFNRMSHREQGRFMKEHPPRTVKRGWQGMLHDNAERLAQVAAELQGMCSAYMLGCLPGPRCGYEECEECAEREHRPALRLVKGGKG